MIDHFCWYLTGDDVDSDTKKCMKMYSAKSDPPAAQFGWQFVSQNAGFTLEDYTQNGKYCESGLAYKGQGNTAKCTQTKKVYHDWLKIENSRNDDYAYSEIFQPYKCEPQNPNMNCKLQFHIEEEDYSGDLAIFNANQESQTNANHVETNCRCAMSNTIEGFCESVIGTNFYEEAVKAEKVVLEKSDCHTRDRNSLMAQKDSCNTAEPLE